VIGRGAGSGARGPGSTRPRPGALAVTPHKLREAWSVRRDANERGAAEPRRQRVPRQSLGTRSAGTRKIQLPERFLILIECASEAEQVRLLSRFHSEGLRCRALIS
jgi:hypothetical protein